MDKREELHEQLVEILGSRNVYFQPPTNIQMKYPAIVYTRSDIRNYNAGNQVYKQTYHYEITVIDRVKDSEIVNKVSKLPTVKWNRHFAHDGLYHDVFTIYY